jgi:hypothetical protein
MRLSQDKVEVVGESLRTRAKFTKTRIFLWTVLFIPKMKNQIDALHQNHLRKINSNFTKKLNKKEI